MLIPKGLHMLEVIGGENCCDGEREWGFNVGESDVKEEFTLKNLEMFCPSEMVFPSTKSCDKKTKLMNVSPVDTSGYLEAGLMHIWQLEIHKG